MAYTKTTWVDGSAPAITAAQLNRIEEGVEDAYNVVDGIVTPVKTSFLDSLAANARIYFGAVSSAGASVSLPAGWSVSRSAEGRYTVTHSLGVTTYLVLCSAINSGTVEGTATSIRVATQASSGFAVQTRAVQSASVSWLDQAFNFVLVRYS